MDCFSDSEPTSTRGLKPATTATTTAFGLVVLRDDVEAKEKADSGCCFADVVIQTAWDQYGGGSQPQEPGGPKTEEKCRSPRIAH